MKVGPLETLKKFAKKVPQSRKNLHKNFLVMGGLEPVLLEPQKSSKKIEAEEATLVWQLVEASL